MPFYARAELFRHIYLSFVFLFCVLCLCFVFVFCVLFFVSTLIEMGELENGESLERPFQEDTLRDLEVT